MANEQGHIELEGLLRDVDLDSDTSAGDEVYRLCVLIEGPDGILYNTFIERNLGDYGPSSREYEPLHQIEELLHNEMYIECDRGQSQRRKKQPPLVTVTVVRSSDSKDDLPLYRAVSPYRIVRSRT